MLSEIFFVRFGSGGFGGRDYRQVNRGPPKPNPMQNFGGAQMPYAFHPAAAAGYGGSYGGSYATSQPTVNAPDWWGN